MNARVDPAVLLAPSNTCPDALLTSRCKAAMRALDQDEALTVASEELELRFDAMQPPYPPEAYGFSSETAPRLSSRQLREMDAWAGYDAAWHKKLRKQITAVVRWEKECAAIKKAIGLTALYRELDRAIEAVHQTVAEIAAMKAATLTGAAYKSLVVTSWIRAGYNLVEAGAALADSVAADVRRLGAEESPRRRPTRGSAAVLQ